MKVAELRDVKRAQLTRGHEQLCNELPVQEEKLAEAWGTRSGVAGYEDNSNGVSRIQAG